MTNDEKAKAYDMALEAARKELGVDRKDWEVVQRVLHNIFPQLRESEDERMWIDIKSHMIHGSFIPFDKIEWIENRLKSLRPVKQELSEKDRKILDDVSHILAGLNYKQVAQDYKQAVENLLSLRPQWKPTEEQMAMLRAVLNDTNNAGAESCQLALTDLYEQLKKL